MAEAARREDWPPTVAEFEAWHAREPERWEFVDGRPRLMTPASMKHSVIKAAFAAPHGALAGTPCTALIDGPQILTEIGGSKPGVSHCPGAMESKRPPLGL